MKNLILLAILAAICTGKTFAQDCEIKVEVLPDQFMNGKITSLSDEVKNIQVTFFAEVMEVKLPLEGKNYKFSVPNENCQAYCKRDKRVRQLNSGDEKLVKNLIKIREEDILAQLRECDL